MALVWITCPDCGEKVLSDRLGEADLLRAHQGVSALRGDETMIDLRPAATVEVGLTAEVDLTVQAPAPPVETPAEVRAERPVGAFGVGRRKASSTR